MADENITITKDSYWTYIQVANYKMPDTWDEHGGKFMVFGNEDEITLLSQILVAYTEIKCFKYAPPSKEMSYHSWALMVYCLDYEADSIWQLLQANGVTKRLWKYDSQSKEDWKAGGRLSNRLNGV